MEEQIRLAHRFPAPIKEPTTLIVLDSVGYDLFCEAFAKNLERIGEVHPAFSDGSYTVPSMAAILTGKLPLCTIPKCLHQELLAMPHGNPFFLEDQAEVMPVHIYTSNPWLYPDLKRRAQNRFSINFHYYEHSECIKEIVNDVLTKDDTFTIIHVMETHAPYTTWFGETRWGDQEPPEIARKYQRRALEYVDENLEPLIDRGGNIIVTADHSEIFTSDHKFGHFPPVFTPGLFRVPIISSNVK